MVVMPEEKGWGAVFLYDQQTKIKKLPIDAYWLEWSADAKKVYFYGGSTIQADAWDILGIYDLDTGQTHRRRLRSPTEIVRVCLKNGNVYSATPVYPGSAGRTVEYDSDIHYLRQITNWLGARFSANCSFVASEADYHGPLPWKIFETGTGKTLFAFDAVDGEDKLPSYSLLEWNPRHESLMLRDHSFGGGVSVVEVFDIKTGKIVQQLPGTGSVAWSADGDSVLMAVGTKLRSVPNSHANR